MDEIQALTERIVTFRDNRDWKQFHNFKDMAISLELEASEVLEHFQWKSLQEMENLDDGARQAIGAELADVVYWVLLLSHDLGIDIKAAFNQKMQRNEEKYPVDKAKGSHKKYTEL